MSETTIYWHDYETWGLNPRADRPSQFAGIRTNLDLEIIDEPLMIYCATGDDFIPHPDSVLITGLTPQEASEKGLNEADFFKRIHDELSRPGTCGVGYNSLRFDDEVTRFGFYRNFIDPYAREWKNGNSRWDILDLVRMTHALRPEGINWPQREEGLPSFRLEALTKANGIEHEGAHDALSDVHATIGLARLLKEKQPKLFEFYFEMRRKNTAVGYLDMKGHTPLLHVSGMYPSSIGCIAPVMPVAIHPRNKNEYIVADLRQDPDALLSLSAEAIGKNLFTPKADLPEGVERVGLKSVHINKSPALAPMSTLNAKAAKRWDIDLTRVMQNRLKLLTDKGLARRVQQVYEQRAPMPPGDVDSGLYGGFITEPDRRECNKVLKAAPEDITAMTPDFSDIRLKELFPRYVARNWPELLSDKARTNWQEFCQARLLEGEFGSTLKLSDYEERMGELGEEELTEEQMANLNSLEEWVANLIG
ncbi:MAG TPA: exodeoxyribonuclease I [Gammaproteobacteria bacterium]|nr:exodeoxyribonuclease I [Gammaproteobacteria bacterium]